MKDKNKLVDLKIHREQKDTLKKYCQKYGYKMYALVEQLIDQNCKENSALLSSKNNKSY